MCHAVWVHLHHNLGNKITEKEDGRLEENEEGMIRSTWGTVGTVPLGDTVSGEALTTCWELRVEMRAHTWVYETRETRVRSPAYANVSSDAGLLFWYWTTVM